MRETLANAGMGGVTDADSSPDDDPQGHTCVISRQACRLSPPAHRLPIYP